MSKKCPICKVESHLCKCKTVNRGSFAKYVSKQETIRERRDKILNLVRTWATIRHPYESKDAEGLLALLDQEGVVIKVEGLPSVFDVGDKVMSALDYKKKLENYEDLENYVKVVPLIEV